MSEYVEHPRAITTAYSIIVTGVLVPPFLLGVLPESGITGITPLIVFLVGVGSLLLGLGLLGYGKGRGWFGVLLDDQRMRLSLSSFQMYLWTLLLLPAVSTALFGNAALYIFVDGAANAIGSTRDGHMVLEEGPLDIAFEWTLVQLAGISAASFLTAPLALRVKSRPTEDAQDDTGLDRRAEIGDAKFSDLVQGEEKSNAGVIDIARLQMLIFTLVLWASYFLMLGKMFHDQNPMVSHFPVFSTTALAFLLASHGGYLGGKVAPRLNTPNKTARAQSRLLRLQRRLEKIERGLEQLAVNPRRSLGVDDEIARTLELSVSLSAKADELQQKLETGADLAEPLAALEGRAEVLEQAATGLRARAGVSEPTAPTATLVEDLRELLAERLGPAPLSGPWSAGDDARLLEALQQIEPDFREDDLADEPQRRLEEGRSILRGEGVR